jgi:hypothetical protein
MAALASLLSLEGVISLRRFNHLAEGSHASISPPNDSAMFAIGCELRPQRSFGQPRCGDKLAQLLETNDICAVDRSQCCIMSQIGGFAGKLREPRTD